MTFVCEVKGVSFDKSLREISISSGGKTVESLTGCIRDLSRLIQIRYISNLILVSSFVEVAVHFNFTPVLLKRCLKLKTFSVLLKL